MRLVRQDGPALIRLRSLAGSSAAELAGAVGAVRELGALLAQMGDSARFPSALSAWTLKVNALQPPSVYETQGYGILGSSIGS